MNGAPDEGDTHQLALMTGRFLPQAGPSTPLPEVVLTRTYARTAQKEHPRARHARQHLPGGAGRAGGRGAAGGAELNVKEE